MQGGRRQPQMTLQCMCSWTGYQHKEQRGSDYNKPKEIVTSFPVLGAVIPLWFYKAKAH